jgi:hypothetical protein
MFKRIITIVILVGLTQSTWAKKENNKVELKDLSIFNSKVPAKQFDDKFLERRHHMLDHHKKMGHVTMGLMTASFITAAIGKKKIDDARAARGGARSGDDAGELNLHMATALATMASYYTTAYFSLNAPKSDDMTDSGARTWHKNLAWVHGTAMVLGPILGMLAFKDYHDGGDPSGISKMHRPLMMLGFTAFAASYGIAVYNW